MKPAPRRRHVPARWPLGWACRARRPLPFRLCQWPARSDRWPSATPTNDRLRAPVRSVNRDAEAGPTSARQFVAYRFETGNSGSGLPSVAIPTRTAAIQNANSSSGNGGVRQAGSAQRVPPSASDCRELRLRQTARLSRLDRSSRSSSEAITATAARSNAWQVVQASGSPAQISAMPSSSERKPAAGGEHAARREPACSELISSVQRLPLHRPSPADSPGLRRMIATRSFRLT